MYTMIYFKNMQVSNMRRPRNSLSERVILDTAEMLLKTGGAPLTIRRIAHELQCSNMALYRYFATKELLESALLDRILSRLDLQHESPDWQPSFIELAFRHKQLIEANAWAIPLFFKNPLPGIAAVKVGESLLQLLAQGGIVGENAVVVLMAILAINYGWAGFTSVRNDALTMGNAHQTVAESLFQLPTVSFPLTTATASYFTEYGNDQQYRHAIALLIGAAQHTQDKSR